MDKVIESLAYVPKALTSRQDDDFMDRLSSHYTTFLLIVFAVVVSVQTYVGDVITCWVPKHVTDSQTKYVNSLCWVKNTYYIPMNQNLPNDDEDREHVIPYYQWVPFILVAQAIFFYLPSIFWHGLNQQGGVDCDSILASAHKLETTAKPIEKEKLFKLLTNQIHRFLISRLKKQHVGQRCNCKNIFTVICRPCRRRFGSYLIVLFLISKILYFANVMGQLFILNAFLSTSYHLYGFELINYLSSDSDWTESPGVAFPRVTYCDFYIRRLANAHRYTVQCTLPINMFTEKIYMFLWFWLVFLAIMTSLGFVVWLMRALSYNDKALFIRNHLGDLDDHDRNYMKDFVSHYLAQDGVFILRLIAHNTNTIIVTEITKSLFNIFKKTLRLKETTAADDTPNGSLKKTPLVEDA